MPFVLPLCTAFFVTLISTALAGSKHACHANKASAGSGANGSLRVTCKTIRFPPRLCHACQLNTPRDDGDFTDCSAIYNLTRAWCRNELRRYAHLNAECDPIRKAQVADFSNKENRAGLDYFVYSICEECCDCIPRGAQQDQYEWRKKRGKLITPNRGNCPAHAYYDICSVWPDVETITGPHGLPKPIGKREKLCKKLEEWIGRPENNPWVLETFKSMDAPIEKFLRQFFKVAKCSQRGLWKRCVDLESKQKRL